MTKQPKDTVLVVGFGIAGALVSWFLEKHNINYVVVDDAAPGSSSPVAAGLINPLAGRSLELAHDLSRFLPFARSTYQQLGEFLGQNIWIDREFLTLLRNEQERKQWQSRALDPGVQEFLAPMDLESSPPSHALAEAGVARVRGGGQVSFSVLLQAFSNHLDQQGRFLRQPFHYSELKAGAAASTNGIPWTFQGRTFCAVLFCEGYRARDNPWFAQLPWRVNRGQRLLLRIPGLMTGPFNAPAVWRKQGLLAPVGPDQFWLGSVNDWDQVSPEPAQAARQALLALLNTMTDFPGQMLDISAGIRPVLKDRKPVAGFHPQFPSLGLLNGLGTKGALLGPWYAAALVDALAEAQPSARRSVFQTAEQDRSSLLRNVSPARFMV
ncbi:MAG: FAD-dependent oxidoreductase [Bacteroidetes bacterium]|nr:FAD-dependent oxidoreductase [Bacteroidota bacterium]